MPTSSALPGRDYGTCALLAFFALLGLAQAATPSRPLNVLFIVADDLRPDLGCYGHAQVKSPHLDRLAARGMRFERAYCQYPVCNPSRASFLSGLRPDTLGILNNETPVRQQHPEIMLLPQLFRAQGYFTASIGKILHAGVDEEGKRVFHRDDKAFMANRDFKPMALGLKGEGRDMGGPSLRWCRWLAAEGSDDDQPDGQNASEAVKLIEAHKDRPFFIAVGFHKPHDPFHAPKQYFDLYPLDSIQLASPAPADRTPDLSVALPNVALFAHFTDRERREFRRAYYAGISFMDAQVGRVLDTLDRHELWDNTIVVFLGDHGYHLGEHDWWNKVTVFELCARVPLIVWAPRAAGMGHSTRGLLELLDLYPTIADLAGLTAPRTLEGRSFRALLADPSGPGKPAAHTIVARGTRIGRSVRTERWRYTEWENGRLGRELYDHTNDPLEYRNLVDEPAHVADVAELKKTLALRP
jgi:iduronate 2-sulfatase